jgi:hypothetical protein
LGTWSYVFALGSAATALGLWLLRPWGRTVAFCWGFVLLNAGVIATFEFVRDAPAAASVAGGALLRLIPTALAIGLFTLLYRHKRVFER